MFSEKSTVYTYITPDAAAEFLRRKIEAEDRGYRLGSDPNLCVEAVREIAGQRDPLVRSALVGGYVGGVVDTLLPLVNVHPEGSRVRALQRFEARQDLTRTVMKWVGRIGG